MGFAPSARERWVSIDVNVSRLVVKHILRVRRRRTRRARVDHSRVHKCLNRRFRTVIVPANADRTTHTNVFGGPRERSGYWAANRSGAGICLREPSGRRSSMGERLSHGEPIILVSFSLLERCDAHPPRGHPLPRRTAMAIVTTSSACRLAGACDTVSSRHRVAHGNHVAGQEKA